MCIYIYIYIYIRVHVLDEAELDDEEEEVGALVRHGPDRNLQPNSPRSKTIA